MEVVFGSATPGGQGPPGPSEGDGDRELDAVEVVANAQGAPPFFRVQGRQGRRNRPGASCRASSRLPGPTAGCRPPGCVGCRPRSSRWCRRHGPGDRTRPPVGGARHRPAPVYSVRTGPVQLGPLGVDPLLDLEQKAESAAGDSPIIGCGYVRVEPFIATGSRIDPVRAF